MTTAFKIFLILFITAYVAMYLPRLFVIRKEKFTRKEFIERYPEFSWLEADLIIDFCVFVVLMFGWVCGAYVLQTPLAIWGLFTIIFMGLALYNGLITAITGICRVPYARRLFLYVHDDNLRSVGWLQIIVSIAAIIALAIGIALYRGPL